MIAKYVPLTIENANYGQLSSIVYKVIYERLLRSENLLRLLVCYDNSKSPYMDESYEKKIKSIGGVNKLVYQNQDVDRCRDVHIYPQPHLPDIKVDHEAYLALSLNGGNDTTRDAGQKNVNLLIDVVVPDTKNVIISGNNECYFAYRMYEIAHEVTALINNQITDTRAYNKIALIGFQRRDYSDSFHGVQLMFNFMINSNLSGTPALPDFEDRMVVRPH